MAVAVHDEYALGLAANLKAALDAREGGQRGLDALERYLEVEPHGDGGERIEHVVAPRHLERRRAEHAAAVDDLERRARAGERQAPRREIGAGLEPVGDH